MSSGNNNNTKKTTVAEIQNAVVSPTQRSL